LDSQVRRRSSSVPPAPYAEDFGLGGSATQKQAARQKAFRRAINDAQASGVIVIRDIGDVTWTWLASGQAEHDISREKLRRNT
jgi:hypothetical protein